MKKQLVLFVFVLSVFITYGQKLNDEHQTKSGKPFLWGAIDKAGLESANYSQWFNKNYEAYEPRTSAVNQLKKPLSKTQIKVFMGTWCGDSKREVPRLYKVLDAAGFPSSSLEVIGVARDAGVYKQGPNNEEEGLNIHRVPTIIVFENGKEKGRIVESPKESLEADLISILEGTYEANYPIVTYVDQLLETKGAKALKLKKAIKLAKQWKDRVSSMSQLNTYAVVLHHANRSEEAIAVMRLNCQLFPEEARAYENLAKIQEKSGDSKGALASYQSLLKLKPDSKQAQEAIARLGV